MSLKPNPSILEIKPYVAGEGAIKGFERIIKLASNENPLGPSPHALEAFKEAADDLYLYPDPAQKAVRLAIAELHDIPLDLSLIHI